MNVLRNESIVCFYFYTCFDNKALARHEQFLELNLKT